MFYENYLLDYHISEGDRDADVTKDGEELSTKDATP